MKKISVRKSPIHGKGVFADEKISRGDRIQYIRGEKKHRVIRNAKESRAIEHWIGMSKSSWITTEGTPFRWINHSCRPNAAIMGSKTLVALENIAENSELTIDYSMTDADPFWGLVCTCGVPSCRHHIRAIYTVPDEVFRRHMPYVPRNFQRIYMTNKAHQRLLQSRDKRISLKKI